MKRRCAPAPIKQFLDLIGHGDDSLLPVFFDNPPETDPRIARITRIKTPPVATTHAFTRSKDDHNELRTDPAVLASGGAADVGSVLILVIRVIL